MKKTDSRSKTATVPPAKAPQRAGAKRATAPSTKVNPAPKKAPVGVPASGDKPKLMRDSFTIPKGEFAALQALKLRAAKLGHPAKKSELLRAGVALLATLTDKALLAALAAIPSLKTGRPKS